MCIIVVDFEMNPVRPKKGKLGREIIEIGAVKLDSQYQIADRFSCLVKPQNGSIAPKIKKLTGIDESFVRRAVEFPEAVRKFSEWIGEEEAVLYAWSECDEKQFRRECECKDVPVPANMEKWIDFQPIYKEKMEIRSEGQLSLQKAAGWHGIKFDSRAAHRAGYDAEITTALVQSVLTGEYQKYLEMIRQYLEPEKEESFGTSLAGMLAGMAV